MEAGKKDTENDVGIGGHRDNSKTQRNGQHKWLASLENILQYILRNEESGQATLLVEELSRATA